MLEWKKKTAKEKKLLFFFLAVAAFFFCSFSFCPSHGWNRMKKRKEKRNEMRNGATIWLTTHFTDNDDDDDWVVIRIDWKSGKTGGTTRHGVKETPTFLVTLLIPLSYATQLNSAQLDSTLLKSHTRKKKRKEKQFLSFSSLISTWATATQNNVPLPLPLLTHNALHLFFYFYFFLF